MDAKKPESDAERAGATARRVWRRGAPRKAIPRPPRPELPDLLVTDLRYEPGIYYQGDSLRFIAREANSGNADAGPFQLEARLSKDTVWSDTDILLGSFSSAPIAAGDHWEIDVEGLIPPDAPPGDYYLGVRVDRDNRIAESDESNNIRWSDVADVTVAVAPLRPTIDVRGFQGVQVTNKRWEVAHNGVSCNFRTVAVNGESRLGTFEVRNLGTGSLNLTGTPKVLISGQHAGDFTVVQQPTSPVAANGGSTTFQVRFDPSREGRREAIASIASNDEAANPFDFTIFGTGTRPRAVVRRGKRVIAHQDHSPSAEDHTLFPPTSVGSSRTHTFALANVGRAPLHLVGATPLRVEGSAGGQFIVRADGPTASAIAPGAERPFTITYRPRIGRYASDRVYIETDDPENPVYWFDVRGLGRQPMIAVSCDGVTITNDDHSPNAADHTDFGEVDINGAPAVRRFTIHSTGAASLSLGNRAVRFVGGDGDAAGFKVVSQPPPIVNANGGSCEFAIAFDPRGLGRRQTLVYIENNGPTSSNPFVFAIAGTGTGVAEPRIEVTGPSGAIAHNDVTPATADGTDFGNVEVGKDGNPHTFVVHSVGAGPLTLGPQPALAIVGPAASDFSVSPSLPPTLPAEGGTAPFDIVFRPTSTGARAARVIINHNDAARAPFVFGITGTGIGADIQVGSDRGSRNPFGRSGDDGRANGNIEDGQTDTGSADGTDFGAVDVHGGWREHTFWIWNRGAVRLHLTGKPPVRIVGPHASDFTVARQPGMTDLLAGSLANFKVRFDPSDVGRRTATVQVANSDFDNSLFEFVVTGTGLVAQMRVLGANHNPVPDGQTEARAANGTLFESQDVNVGRQSRQFSVENLGQAALHVGQIGTSGPHANDFGVAIDRVDIDSGTSATLTITFDPELPGPCNAVVSIPSNDGQSPYTFAVAGNATGVPWPEISIATSGTWGSRRSIENGHTAAGNVTILDLGSVAVDSETRQYDFSIGNDGGGTLHLTGSPLVKLAGEHRSDFSVIRQPERDLTRNRSTWFSLAFAPTVVGTRTATVSIANNDADENPFEFVVQGTGGYPRMIVHAGAVDGPVVQPGSRPSKGLGTAMASPDGQPVARTFIIENAGQGTLLLAGSPSVRITGAGAGAFSASVGDGRVEAGGHDTLTVRFRPPAGGTFEASLSLSTNDPERTNYSFDLQGFWAAPVADIRGNNLVIARGDTTPSIDDGTDFGVVDVSADGVAHTFTLTNTGSGNLVLPGERPVIVGSGDFRVIGDLPTVIEPGDSASFDIVFTPRQLEPQQKTVRLACNDPQPYTFVIQGSGTGILAADIQVSGGIDTVAIDSGTTTVSTDAGTAFGAVPVGDGTSGVFAVTNVGNATLILGSVEFAGAAAEDFYASPATRRSLGPYEPDQPQVARIEVAFTPRAAGLRQAVFTLPSNDPDTAVYTFAVEGTGLIPTIQVRGNGQVIASGDHTPSVSDGTDFGGCDVGGVVERTFTVDNTGPVPLGLTGIPVVAVAGPHASEFVVAQAPARYQFPATLRVEFRPAAPGPRTATVSIVSNDLGQNPFVFAVRGTALTGSIRVRSVGGQAITNGSVQPGSSNNTDFGATHTGGSSILRQFVIANAGDGSLQLTGHPVVAVGGEHGGDFVVERQAGGPLVPGGTSLFEIRFTPGAVGVRRGTVTILSSDPESGTFTFAVQGRGTSGPNIQVLGGDLLDQEVVNNDITPSATDGTDFGLVRIGEKAESRFRVRNTGGSTLTLTGTPLVRIASAGPTDFRISSAPQASIGPGTQTQFTIEFLPTRHGVQSATVEIHSDDLQESRYRFDIQGDTAR